MRRPNPKTDFHIRTPCGVSSARHAARIGPLVTLRYAVASFVEAQSYRIIPLPEPKIVSGADFGIRVEGDQNGTAVGPLVVRVNGKWIDAREGHVQGVPPITSR